MQHRGVAFSDAYMETKGGVSVVKPKSPCNDCDVRLPMELGWPPPDHAVEMLAILLATKFAGSDGFGALFCMSSMVFGRAEMPHVLLVPVCAGLDGKSLVFVDLMEAARGENFGEAPSTMLQVPREFH